MSVPIPRPVILCVLDGWGHREAAEDNAIRLGRTPVFDRLWTEEPHALLLTSAGDVGLPEGQMGNSEVGHQNLGAGRVVLQDLPRVDRAIADGSLAASPALGRFVAALKASGGTCQLIGLLSPGGVHSHDRHLLALARIVAAAGVKVAVHGFLDGRDTPPRSARDIVAGFARAIADAPAEAPGIAIASLAGRYYAMDRDKRWERIERAYRLLVDAAGARAADAVGAIEASYRDDLSDEFMLPTALGGYAGMADGDGLLMANFRADRARQLLTALVDPAFDGFARRLVEFAARLGMVSYSDALDVFMPALFPRSDLSGTLPEAVAKAGLRQLRIAETEKYAHVTFFLNGGSEQAFPGEERILVPSPRVATYDLKPEMSAEEVTDRLVEAIRSRRFDLIVVNYANADMVGHSGKLAAAIAAVEAVDRCLGRLEAATREAGGVMLITADHGNVEMMRDPETGESHTAHTTNPVPALLVNAPAGLALDGGRLADVAPTLLELMRLERPKAMTGRSLLRRAAGGGRADLHARA
jgi:2,3-bisphosphoglycerate-independent phosphoglycerate mutase